MTKSADRGRKWTVVTRLAVIPRPWRRGERRGKPPQVGVPNDLQHDPTFYPLPTIKTGGQVEDAGSRPGGHRGRARTAGGSAELPGHSLVFYIDDLTIDVTTTA